MEFADVQADSSKTVNVLPPAPLDGLPLMEHANSVTVTVVNAQERLPLAQLARLDSC